MSRVWDAPPVPITYTSELPSRVLRNRILEASGDQAGSGLRGRVGREPSLQRAARRHGVDLVVAVAVRAERDPLSVGRPGRLVVVRPGRWSVGSARCRPRSSRRSRGCRPSRSLLKAILVPSGDQAGASSMPGIVREVRLAAAVRVHHVDLPVAVAVAAEGDLRCPSGDQVGCDLAAGVVGEPRLARCRPRSSRRSRRCPRPGSW